MSRAALMAAVASMGGVAAAWDLLWVLQNDGAPLVARTLSPLRTASRTGTSPTVAERRRLAVLASLTLLAGGWLLAGPVLALLAAACAPALVGGVVGFRRRRWRAALGDGIPAVSRALADALSGGHSIRGALTEATRGGVPGPAGAELRDAARALELGAPTEMVLERLRARAGTPAADTLVAAVLLQREAGGDLAGLLRDLAGSLEAGARLARDARSVTAQARFTGWLVAGLPVGAAAVASLAQPSLIPGLMTSPLSAAMLIGAALFQVAGLLAIRRLGRVGV